MKIAIIGGAGYIGSVVTESFVNDNKVYIYDDLSTGCKKLINPKAKFTKGSILDFKKLDFFFRRVKPELVIHLAAKIVVPESVAKPLEYYENNVVGTLNVLKAMKKHNIKKIIFSSSAATYGNQAKMPIDEGTLQTPCNPYGQSKLISEKMLFDAKTTHGINYVIFRFFNVAGASNTGNYGMMSKSPTLLVPSLNKAFLENKKLAVFGNDYDTKDGSCLRDYVHVEDLAIAHLQAVEFLAKNKSGCFNLGSNQGYTVLEVIKTAEKVFGKKILYEIKKRRPGDPAVLLTSNKLAFNDLKWKPKYSLEQMISSDFEFRKSKITN